MLQLSSIIAVVASALALAHPQGGSSSGASTAPSNTTLFYYTGTTSADCGYLVGQGEIEEGVCTKITNQGLGLAHVDEACTFTLYSGTTTCGGSGASSTTIPIPQGTGLTCFFTGVEDGGLHYFGSGTWTCP